MFQPMSPVARILLMVLVLSLSVACSGQKRGKGPDLDRAAQMNAPEYLIGVPEGAAAMAVGEKQFARARLKYYNSLADGYAAVKYGKIDGFLFDSHNLEYYVSHHADMALLPDKVGDECISVGVPDAPAHRELLREVNAFIARYRADGTYAAMRRYWFAPGEKVLPEIPLPAAPLRTLKVGTEGLNEPMNYVAADGTLTGFDLEFMRRLALFLNVRLEVTAMNFGALIPSCQTGKIDLLIANLNATPERSQNMLFSDSYIDCDLRMLVRKERIKAVAAFSLNAQRVGVMTGSIGELLVEERFPRARRYSFDGFPDAVAALQGHKIDCVIGSFTSMLNYTRKDPGLTVLPEMLTRDGNGVAVHKERPDLLRQINAALEKLEADGTLAALRQNWIRPADAPYVRLPVPERGVEAPVLKVGLAADREPMCFVLDGAYAGLDCDMIRHVAYQLGRRVEFQNMKFGSLIAALQAGKIDVIASNMVVTPERAEKVNFSRVYFENPQAILMHKAGAPVAAESQDDSFARLRGKKVAVTTGALFDQFLKEAVPEAIPVYYNSFPDKYAALDNGKVDAVIEDEPIARCLPQTWPHFRLLPKRVRDDRYAFILGRDKTELAERLSREIRRMREEGTLKEFDGIWFGSDETRKVVPPLPATGPLLRFAVAAANPPFTYVRDGIFVGYDVAVASLAAARMGCTLELVPFDFQGLIPAVTSGKCDFGGSCITVTEERKKQVLFTEPNYEGGIVFVVRDDTAASAMAASGAAGRSRLSVLAASLGQSFRSTFLVESRWKLVLHGLGVTVLISLSAISLGTLLALLVCYCRRSRLRLLQYSARAYIDLMRGTPIVVLLMILYYIVFQKVDIHPIPVAIVGFALNFAAYAAESFRSGVDAIDRGQLEAAAATGFTDFHIFRLLTFPQAARHVLPVYKGEIISTVKSTSIVGYIAIQDLTKMSDIIRSRTYEAFFPLIATALIYFALSYGVIHLLSLVENRIDPRQRKRVIAGVEVQS